MEFVRGRYYINKGDYLIYIFKQMKKYEIEKIKQSLTMDDGFEYLWIELWGIPNEKTKHDYQKKQNLIAKNKKEARQKYDMLKLDYDDKPKIDLEYLVNNVKPTYDTDEWGFPKGRINRYETKLQCAVREFKEESGYEDDDFRIIDTIEPIVENFIGTNGIKYRHVYYVADLITDKKAKNNITDSQRNEVGSIGFFLLDNVTSMIREYHSERINIVHNVFNLYLNEILFNENNNLHDKVKVKKIVSNNNDEENKLQRMY